MSDDDSAGGWPADKACAALGVEDTDLHRAETEASAWAATVDPTLNAMVDRVARAAGMPRSAAAFAVATRLGSVAVEAAGCDPSVLFAAAAARRADGRSADHVAGVERAMARTDRGDDQDDDQGT